MRNASDESCTGYEETFYVRQLSSENCAVNEIMWENPVVPDRPQMTIYRVSQEECARLREGVPYVKVYPYNPKHLYPKLNG
jgi:hypothetical protein